MDAIKMLTEQHREVEKLFKQFEEASDGAKKSKERLCRQISDELAIHAAIEENVFYPAGKDARTEDELHEAVEEHLSAKRIIADLLETDADDEQLKARMKVLKEQVEHHVEEEEKELFPKIKKLLGKEELEELGARMQQMADELREQGDPRMQIPDQTDHPAPI